MNTVLFILHSDCVQESGLLLAQSRPQRRVISQAADDFVERNVAVQLAQKRAHLATAALSRPPPPRVAVHIAQGLRNVRDSTQRVRHAVHELD